MNRAGTASQYCCAGPIARPRGCSRGGDMLPLRTRSSRRWWCSMDTISSGGAGLRRSGSRRSVTPSPDGFFPSRLPNLAGTRGRGDERPRGGPVHVSTFSDVFMLEGVPTDRRWPRLLSEIWPAGRMTLHRQFTQPAPIADLDGWSHEEWFGSKSRDFRQSMRRRSRQLEAAGARLCLTRDESRLPADLEAFARLHYQRWATLGGSRVLNPRVQRVLAEASRALIGDLRFRLWSIKVGTETISSHIFLSAGGETTYWLGSFDERWGSPATGDLDNPRCDPPCILGRGSSVRSRYRRATLQVPFLRYGGSPGVGASRSAWSQSSFGPAVRCWA
jgi:Acetyltransferase (GNAT) domain